MFKLLRYFSFASASVMIVAVIIFAMVFRQYEIDELIESAEIQNVSLARSFANVIWDDVSPYVEAVSGIDRAALRARPEIQKINQQLKKITAGLPILKVKIYNLNGIVIFSSEFSQIGDDKSTNTGFLSAAREEKPASMLTFRNTFSAFDGRVLGRNLIASYLPVYSSGNSLDGVFELYMDVSPLVKKIDETTVRLGVILTVFFLMLYGILFLIVRRADVILRKQHIKLTESQHELEKRVAERTKELFKSEERFSLAMRGANDGLWDWNLKTNYIYLSPRLCQMQGYEQEELEPVLGTWESLVHPNDKERVFKKVQEYISGDAYSFETEFRMRHKDGSWISILSRAFLVHENGEAVRLVG
ncbi:MAG: PAS domain-containing protein, partial [Rhodospirillaceae bacterium]|nr:PAS domain-containing protein [Rhodospirillaceae bacterium]